MKSLAIPAIAIAILFVAFVLTPVERSIHASSCSGFEPTVAKSCSGESREVRTPIRSFIAKQPVRKTVSVLKPAKKSCNGE